MKIGRLVQKAERRVVQMSDGEFKHSGKSSKTLQDVQTFSHNLKVLEVEFKGLTMV